MHRIPIYWRTRSSRRSSQPPLPISDGRASTTVMTPGALFTAATNTRSSQFATQQHLFETALRHLGDKTVLNPHTQHRIGRTRKLIFVTARQTAASSFSKTTTQIRKKYFLCFSASKLRSNQQRDFCTAPNCSASIYLDEEAQRLQSEKSKDCFCTLSQTHTSPASRRMTNPIHAIHQPSSIL
jgi:hypothetical protein